MKFRPQFRLRTLLIVVAIVAAFMGWRQYSKHWLAERHEALVWIGIHGEAYHPGVTWSVGDDKSNIPWNLRFWGETETLIFAAFDLAVLPEADRFRVEQFKRLFPEVDVYVLE